MLLKLNAKFESERNDEKISLSKRDKDSKKKKVKPSGPGSDKRSSQASQDNQASSDNSGQARTSEITIKRIQKIDLNASDVDSVDNARSGI